MLYQWASLQGGIGVNTDDTMKPKSTSTTRNMMTVMVLRAEKVIDGSRGSIGDVLTYNRTV